MGNNNQSASQPSRPAAATFAPSDSFFLLQAARAGDVEVLRLFLDKNPSLAWAVALDHTSAWHCAAEEGHDKALALLAQVSRSAAASNTHDPTSRVANQADARGRTPLMLACRGGHTGCTEVLLENGANIYAVDQEGVTALHHAAWSEHGSCLARLLQHAGPCLGPQDFVNHQIHAWLNSPDPLYARTSLHLACWNGHQEAVAALLSAGASLNVKTSADCYEAALPANAGTTPLHLAAMRGHQGIVLALIAAHVKAARRSSQLLPDPRQAVDAYQNTPYSIAAARHHDAPLMMEVLNPVTVIRDLQRLARRREQQQQQVVQSEPGLPSSVQQPVPAQGNGTAAASSPGGSSKGGVASRMRKGGCNEADGETSDMQTGAASEEDDEASSNYSDSSSSCCTSSAANSPGPNAIVHKSVSIRELRRLFPVYSNDVRSALAAGVALAGPTSHSLAPSDSPSPSSLHLTPREPAGVTAASRDASGAGRGAAGWAGIGNHERMAGLGVQAVESHVELSANPVPDVFLCPLTLHAFHDPVCASDGYSYERAAIEKHLASGSVISPMTKRKLISTTLYTNSSLAASVRLWLESNPGQCPEDMS